MCRLLLSAVIILTQPKFETITPDTFLSDKSTFPNLAIGGGEVEGRMVAVLLFCGTLEHFRVTYYV